MAEVSISIAGRTYDIFCEDGEEAELEKLAKIVDEKAQQAVNVVGGLNETRVLLFAALFLADENITVRKQAANATPAASANGAAPAQEDLAPMGQALEKLAARIESLASTFEQY
jgi:cell division protein ZapA